MKSVPSALSVLRHESTLLSVLAALALVLKLIVAAAGLPATASASEIICSSAGSAPVEQPSAPLHGGDLCLCGPACAHLASAGASLMPPTAAVDLPSLASVSVAVPEDRAAPSPPGPFGSLGSRAPPYV